MTTEIKSGLLQRFSQSGDAEAFAQITRQYAGMVYGTCLRITGNQEAAADAAQDTFFEFLKNARRVTGSLGGWLHQVATRRAIDLVRRDSSRRQREQAYAAQAALETDHWSDVSPLVDAAMNELESPMREVLIGHYLQGQITVQMAADQGVAQSTISRRVEQALTQLRDRLRTEGVLVAATSLAAWMGHAAQSAPASVLAELGKMAVATSGTVAGTAAAAVLSGVRLKVAAAAMVATLGVGGYVAYQHNRPTPLAQERVEETTARAGVITTAGNSLDAIASDFVSAGNAADPTADLAVADRPGDVDDIETAPESESAPLGGLGYGGDSRALAQPMGFGGYGTRMAVSAPGPSRSPQLALHRFAMELRRGDLSRLEQCFVPDSPEAAAFRRLLENPQTAAERRMKQCLESLGQPIEIVETTPWEDGLKVKWKATVRNPFVLDENGTIKNWQEGDKFDLEVRLKQVGEDWKIAGF